MKNKFIKDLEKHLLLVKNEKDAREMRGYMKNKFDFIGVKVHVRAQLLKYLYPDHSEEIEENLIEIVYELFQKEEREYQYIALELLKKNIDQIYKIEHILLLKKLSELKPQWDTIDIFAKDILGKYLLKFPEMTETIVNLMNNSNYIWKIRTSLLFQIHYKEKTNGELLFKTIKKFKNHPDHFIQNAICWSLNEYSKYEPKLVNEFVKKNNISQMKKLCISCVESKKRNFINK